MLFNKFITLLHLNGEYHRIKYDKINTIYSADLVEYVSSEKLAENAKDILFKLFKCFSSKKLYNPRSRGVQEVIHWFFYDKEEMLRFSEILMDKYEDDSFMKNYFNEKYGYMEKDIDMELKHVRKLLLNMQRYFVVLF
ncbi:hypothetical protein [Epinotia aporema granulovirus]|uniref:Uncharacterized protein n=1 Tax=Epinotia aporema granulovirus TaxID=166056 RepID=K4EQU2_9BBAC|nr:hypothetical protein [Epinotia aporema granulovirus]AER41531.1 hypothetical protein [Epinotia aporema granulovirus]